MEQPSSLIGDTSLEVNHPDVVEKSKKKLNTTISHTKHASPKNSCARLNCKTAVRDGRIVYSKHFQINVSFVFNPGTLHKLNSSNKCRIEMAERNKTSILRLKTKYILSIMAAGEWLFEKSAFSWFSLPKFEKGSRPCSKFLVLRVQIIFKSSSCLPAGKQLNARIQLIQWNAYGPKWRDLLHELH